MLDSRGGYSDVVGEAQELVALLLKSVLRSLGVEVSKVHDVGTVLLRYAEQLPADARVGLGEVARISKRLRKERELSFYGAKDFIPTDEYGPQDGRQARAEAQYVFDWVNRLYPE